MAEKLKSCPFCGNVPEDDGYGDGEYFCKTCDLWGIRPEWWNTRAEPERHVLGVGVPWLSADVDFDRDAVVLTDAEGWRCGQGVDMQSAWPGGSLNGNYRLILEKEAGG